MKPTVKDPLGTRIKENYENRSRQYLPRRTYTIIRLDGCHWHTYTKQFNRPFDSDLISDLNSAVIASMAHIQGAVFAYVQSDEVSILLTDFATIQTNAWFDGNIQKISSVSASILTAEFNRVRISNLIREYMDQRDYPDDFDINKQMATFDSRCFSIPDRTEVMNYFIWRNQDCSRNSLSMVAQSHFSPKELHGKGKADIHEMLNSKGINWATDYPEDHKNGRLIVKTSIQDPTTSIVRNSWKLQPAWKFTEDMDRLLNMIPINPGNSYT